MKRFPLLALVVALVFAPVAGAKSFSVRVLSDAHVGKTKAELVAQKTFSTRMIDHYAAGHADHWKVAARHSTCWSHLPRRWARTCDRARKRVLAHRWLLKVANGRLSHMYPSRPSIEPWLARAFECIHEHEGTWNANTGNGYHGGLQMDAVFQYTYGPEYVRQWGGAENWPIWAQLDAASKAYHSGRGFGPWPNTARACGLL